jgi:hypothetical protein
MNKIKRFERRSSVNMLLYKVIPNADPGAGNLSARGYSDEPVYIPDIILNYKLKNV